MNSVNIWSFFAALIISAGIWFLLTSAIDAVDDIITNKKKEKEECTGKENNDVTSTSFKEEEL